jgi:hypothetical protein
MKRRGLKLGAWVLVVIAAAVPGIARADGDAIAKAQARFDEGMVLMRAGKAAAACPKLEESQKLDPGMGTEFRLAECYEATDRLASAWTLFSKVADEAKLAGKGDRAAVAITRAANLAPKLSMLTVVVSKEAASVPGLVITRDDAVFPSSEWGVKEPINPGEHRFRAKAPGKFGWETVIAMVHGATMELAIPVLGATPPAPPAPPVPKEEGAPLRPARIAAIAAAGVGLIGVGVGSAFGLSAKSQWSKAQDEESKNRSQAHADQQDASRSAAASTASFIIGGAAIAAAGVLWFIPPAQKPSSNKGLWVVPAAGQGTAGAVVSGRF